MAQRDLKLRDFYRDVYRRFKPFKETPGRYDVYLDCLNHFDARLGREPAKLKTVRHKKRRPCIRARQRMKRRLKTEAYSLSQKCRKKIEECFGWLKTIAGMDRGRVVGRLKLRQLLEVSAAAFNLVRMRRLAPLA